MHRHTPPAIVLEALGSRWLGMSVLEPLYGTGYRLEDGRGVGGWYISPADTARPFSAPIPGTIASSRSV